MTIQFLQAYLLILKSVLWMELGEYKLEADICSSMALEKCSNFPLAILINAWFLGSLSNSVSNREIAEEKLNKLEGMNLGSLSRNVFYSDALDYFKKYPYKEWCEWFEREKRHAFTEPVRDVGEMISKIG